MTCFSRVLLYLFLAAGTFSAAATTRDTPDSVYLFAYATAKNTNHNGLHFAWSRDKKSWYRIGDEYGFLKSDYSRWGSEKRMITPFVFPGRDGLFHAVWTLNERVNQFAHAASADLADWGRQSYPYLPAGMTVSRPVVHYDASRNRYVMAWYNATKRYYAIETTDFKTYTPAAEIAESAYRDPSVVVALPGGDASGQVYRVPWATVDKLVKTVKLSEYKATKNGETTAQDGQRFAGLKPVTATVTARVADEHPISDLLLGIFFEDINYAADGGLYGELVQNRDFEYSPADKEGRDRQWNNLTAWTLRGERATLAIDSSAPIHPNNPHYAVLNVSSPGASLANSGYDNIVVKKGENYLLSVFARSSAAAKFEVSLVSERSGVLARTTLSCGKNAWKAATATLAPSTDAADVRLELKPLSAGRFDMDMVSLFPQQTFKGRRNGMRADLAQSIADIHPRFVRFPGGCVAHGDGIANIYRWKNTIGRLEARKPQRNLWGYHQSAGLGYFEYFRFCEDIGAEPVPVVAAGVPCQNSATGGGGQQGGIPIDQMDEYVQDVLDLVEYANGPVTSTWGKKRADAGHPQPFNLKYIGIGNEDLITDVFEERFDMIYNAMRKAHPEITVIGTVGPFYEGTDYEQGWALADKDNIPMVDEHYYNPPGWFINNQDFYDKYDRTKSKVYLGEYAAHLPGKPNNLETALAEALYLASLERNGDVVHMASYAPLLAREGHTQWNPDLIYFNNSQVKPTVGYEVQRLYGQNAGDRYIPTAVSLSNEQDAVSKRVAVSMVRDSNTGDIIVKLVNLLPVAVSPTLNLQGTGAASGEAVKTVLTGKPADRNARPVTSMITIAGNLAVELPAYSFTVIRMKGITAKQR